jgi:hypothetical protein
MVVSTKHAPRRFRQIPRFREGIGSWWRRHVPGNDRRPPAADAAPRRAAGRRGRRRAGVDAARSLS